MKFQTNQPLLAKHQRDLRSNSTDAERIVWQNLRSRQLLGAKFRRQHVVENYIVDFVSFDAMLVVELDGSQHAEQKVYDEKRNGVLESAGFHMLRFWNSDVMVNIDGVISTIYAEISKRVSERIKSE
jgi:crossover junction endodeoxyribonuclease RuvC